MSEAELKEKVTNDLSKYFLVTHREKQGRHISGKRGIRYDLICEPYTIGEWGFTKPFLIELKVLPPGDKGRRKIVRQGFWQAYEQLNETDWGGKEFQFALFACNESYGGITDKKTREYLKSQLFSHCVKNVGWLRMDGNRPFFWMSQQGGEGKNGFKAPPRPLWQPYDDLDTSQLKTIIGSGRDNSKAF